MTTKSNPEQEILETKNNCPDQTCKKLLFETIYKRERRDVKCRNAEQQNESSCIQDIKSQIRQILCDGGNCINECDSRGDSPLTCSVLQKDVQLCKALLECGAKINKFDELGKTALYHAAELGNKNILQILMEKGANPNRRTRRNKYSPLHIAAFKGHFEIIRMLVQYKSTSVNIKDGRGRTVFLMAVEEKLNEDTLRVLLEIGVDPDLASKEKNAALSLITKRGDLDVARLLIKHGCNLNIKNKEGKTPLYIAVEQGHRLIIDELFLYLDTNSAIKLTSICDSSEHTTALHFGIANDYEESLLSLLASNKTEIDEKNKFGQSPLMYAVVRNNFMAIDVLVRAGANLNTDDDQGRTPLIFAKMHQSLKSWIALKGMFKDYEEDAIDGFKTKNKLLLLAITENEYDILYQPAFTEELIKNGAFIEDIHMTTALEMIKSHSRILSILLQYKNRMRLLNNCRCLDIAVFLGDKNTAQAILEGGGRSSISLIMSIERNNIEMMKLLLKFGEKPDGVSLTTGEPIKTAIIYNNLEAAKLLFEEKCSANEIFQIFLNQKSALELGITKGNLEMLKLLIKNGAKSSQRDELSVAIKTNKLWIVKLLVDALFKIEPHHIVLAISLDFDLIADFISFQYEERLCLSNEENMSDSIIDPILMDEYTMKEHVERLMKRRQQKTVIKMFLLAAKKGYNDILQLILDQNSYIDVNTKGLGKRTALHCAAEGNCLDTIDYLLEAGAELNKLDEHNKTSLFVSIENNHIETSLELLSKGASTSGRTSRGYTVLQEAIKKGNLHLVRKLMQKVETPILVASDVFYVKQIKDKCMRKEMYEFLIEFFKDGDEHGDDAALGALKSGDIKLLRTLFELDKNLVNSRNNKTGESLLHISMDLRNNKEELVYKNFDKLFVLLEEFGVELDVFCTAKEETPLFKSIQIGRIDIAEMLVKSKANCNLGSRIRKMSAISMADSLKYPNLVTMMINSGASPPSGWPLRVNSLQNIVRIAIRKRIPQKGFRKTIQSYEAIIQDIFIEFMLLNWEALR